MIISEAAAKTIICSGMQSHRTGRCSRPRQDDYGACGSNTGYRHVFGLVLVTEEYHENQRTEVEDMVIRISNLQPLLHCQHATYVIDSASETDVVRIS